MIRVMFEEQRAGQSGRAAAHDRNDHDVKLLTLLPDFRQRAMRSAIQGIGRAAIQKTGAFGTG